MSCGGITKSCKSQRSRNRFKVAFLLQQCFVIITTPLMNASGITNLVEHLVCRHAETPLESALVRYQHLKVRTYNPVRLYHLHVSEKTITTCDKMTLIRFQIHHIYSVVY